MKFVKPECLKNGTTFSFIAPAGPVDKEKAYTSKAYFESLGFKVKFGNNLFKKSSYLAGDDAQRLNDIHWAFSDPEVNAIICARGGYGCLRLIDKIDYDIVRNNPKIFCGHSDITILSLMFLKEAGLVTYSSPMPQGDFQTDNLDNYTCNSFLDTLRTGKTIVKPLQIKKYFDGQCEGVLIGGNLSSIASMCGIDFVPDEKFIFFTEDLNEPVYKIDRYFRQLLNIKTFRTNLVGIALGDFLGIENSQELDSMLFQLANELKIPIYSGFPISHSSVKATIPVGSKAKLSENALEVF